MERERWERVEALFHAAAALPVHDREPFLREACGGDAGLLDEVNSLLAEDARGCAPLDGGLAPLAGEMLDGADSAQLRLRELGPYRILRLLGEGGMGTVYLARRLDIGGLVAIKVLRDAWMSPARRERFAAEQRTLAQLSHPAIAQIHDTGALPDGTPWFVMEYVEGLPLTDYCRSRATSIEGRLELFRRVCEAVQYAHGQAVIHRDLKPSNILVKPDGTIKLLDFGIAKHLVTTEATIDQTRTGLRLMTPAYAAPEQIRGERVGIRSDVYALGVILYELLTGALPFDLATRTPAEAISLLASVEPERPSAAVQRLGAGEGPLFRAAGRASWADLDVLCLAAMHKDQLRRYPSVEALIRDIDHYLAHEPLEARPDAVGYRVERFVRRNRSAVTAGALVVAAIVMLVAFYTTRLGRARDAALAEAARTQRIQRFMLDLFEGGDPAVAPAAGLSVVTLLERGVQEAQALDGEPLLQAELYGTLGGIYHKLGELERADGLLRSALDRRRTLLGSAHPDVAASEVALGLLRADQAAYDEAERLARSGLEAARRVLPRDHPEVAAATAALGHVLVERGAYADAIAVLDEAARMYSLRGEASPELASTLHELSNAHFYTGDRDTAESISRRVLAMSRELHGERHPHVAEDLVNLGAIQHEQGRYTEAEAFYREALEITRSWHGDDHYQTASTLTMLGRSLVFQGRLDEAEALLEQALAIQERVFGPDHPRVASAVNDLGTVALQRDDFDAAESAFRRMAGIYRRAHPDGHYLVGIALSNLASVHQARKEYAEAETLYREAIAIYRATLPPDHLNTAIARIKLGRSLLRQGRYAEAERESLAGHDTAASQAAPSVSWLRSAREDLAAIYDGLGRPDEAARYRGEGADGVAPGGRR